MGRSTAIATMGPFKLQKGPLAKNVNRLTFFVLGHFYDMQIEIKLDKTKLNLEASLQALPKEYNKEKRWMSKKT